MSFLASSLIDRSARGRDECSTSGKCGFGIRENVRYDDVFVLIWRFLEAQIWTRSEPWSGGYLDRTLSAVGAKKRITVHVTLPLEQLSVYCITKSKPSIRPPRPPPRKASAGRDLQRAWLHWLHWLRLDASAPEPHEAPE